METFTVKDLTFAYPGRTRPALKTVSFSIEQGAFVVLAGCSGSGKSTLLRQLKPALTPHGVRTGIIRYQGEDLSLLSPERQASEIGFVMQNPEHQLVTDKVWHELAFGLENLGMEPERIRLRVGEMASFFGIQTWFHKAIAALSGGQKQILNLAAILAMSPKVLILDEPTAQLDPIAAEDFFRVLVKINRELGVTILLSEQRLQEVLPLSDRALILDQGGLLAEGRPKEVFCDLKKKNHPMAQAMPAPLRLCAALDPAEAHPPLTVREGRAWFHQFISTHPAHGQQQDRPSRRSPDPPVLQLKDVWFRYTGEGEDVLRGLTLDVRPGEVHAVLGGNGAGKSTALGLMSGFFSPYRGKVLRPGKKGGRQRKERAPLLGVLPQDPQTLFVKDCLREDLEQILREQKRTKEERLKKVEAAAETFQLRSLLDSHPYDLSGGEQQRAALAKIWLLEPDILLLDEPTKGMDEAGKRSFGGLIQAAAAQGKAVLLVSHDVEFCARWADWCTLFFDGQAISQDTPARFFSKNQFYTTVTNRMVRDVLAQAVTPEDVMARW